MIQNQKIFFFWILRELISLIIIYINNCMKNNTLVNIEFNTLDRISHILILKSSYLSDIGLFEGKMGVAIAFANMSIFANNNIYYDCMSDVLDDVLENIHKGLNYGFKSGLSGVGWGIEYLIQHEFVDGDSSEICEEIDNRIMEIDPKRILDQSMEEGFEGLLHYIVYHLQGAIMQNSELPFDRAYLLDVYAACRDFKKSEISNSFALLIDNFISFIETKKYFNYTIEPICFVSHVLKIDKNQLASYPLGLRNGLSGELLNLISKCS